MSGLIRLTSVTKSYHGSAPVLDGLDWALEPGSFVCVMGGSGAGKTSLLRLLAAEDRPSSGRCEIFGVDLATVSPEALRQIRSRIGFVPQSGRLISDLTVFENIRLGIDCAAPSCRQKATASSVGEWIEAFGLGPLRNRRVADLSGGESQRVALVRALARHPELLIADEPTGAQDRARTLEVLEQFQRVHQKGTTVVVATHDADWVRRGRHRMVVLKSGKLNPGEGAWSF